MPTRLSVGLSLVLFSSIAACERASTPDEEPGPSQSSQTLSEKGGNGPAAEVEIRINHNPVITAMNAEWLSPSTQQLSVQASDRDGDTLVFVWSADCAGRFQDPRAAQLVFTYDQPLPSLCGFRVDVSDGAGGKQSGTLTVSPAPVVAPVADESDGQI